jgi:hypothetical protein
MAGEIGNRRPDEVVQSARLEGVPETHDSSQQRKYRRATSKMQHAAAPAPNDTRTARHAAAPINRPLAAPLRRQLSRVQNR